MDAKRQGHSNQSKMNNYNVITLNFLRLGSPFLFSKWREPCCVQHLLNFLEMSGSLGETSWLCLWYEIKVPESKEHYMETYFGWASGLLRHWDDKEFHLTCHIQEKCSDCLEGYVQKISNVVCGPNKNSALISEQCVL